MSYILDALKKAETERKLGSVPSVYMEPVPLAKSDEPVSPMHRPWVWLAAALLAVAGIAAAWMMAAQKPEQADSVPPVAQSPVAAPSQAKERSLEGAARPMTAQVARPSPKKEETLRPSKKTAPASAPAKAVAAAPAHSGKESLAKAEGHAGPEKNSVESVPAQAKLSSAPAPQVAEDDMHIADLRELPDQVRRSIPPIAVGGYIYSPNPADRSMLLNNRLIREGERAPSGVTLEKMMPKEAILSYQGQRFRLPY